MVIVPDLFGPKKQLMMPRMCACMGRVTGSNLGCSGVVTFTSAWYAAPFTGRRQQHLGSSTP